MLQPWGEDLAVREIFRADGDQIMDGEEHGSRVFFIPASNGRGDDGCGDDSGRSPMRDVRTSAVTTRSVMLRPSPKFGLPAPEAQCA